MLSSMEKIVNLCKSRGYVYPGSEIYGGLANTWDYGPLGSELKKPNSFSFFCISNTSEPYIPDFKFLNPFPNAP